MSDRRLPTALVVLFVLTCVGRPAAVPKALVLNELTLCSVVRGDGICKPQPYGAYSPGQRLWARVEIGGFARHGPAVDLELIVEVQTLDGPIVYRDAVIDGPHTGASQSEERVRRRHLRH